MVNENAQKVAEQLMKLLPKGHVKKMTLPSGNNEKMDPADFMKRSDKHSFRELMGQAVHPIDAAIRGIEQSEKISEMKDTLKPIVANIEFFKSVGREIEYGEFKEELQTRLGLDKSGMKTRFSEIYNELRSDALKEEVIRKKMEKESSDMTIKDEICMMVYDKDIPINEREYYAASALYKYFVEKNVLFMLKNGNEYSMLYWGVEYDLMNSENNPKLHHLMFEHTGFSITGVTGRQILHAFNAIVAAPKNSANLKQIDGATWYVVKHDGNRMTLYVYMGGYSMLKIPTDGKIEKMIVGSEDSVIYLCDHFKEWDYDDGVAFAEGECDDTGLVEGFTEWDIRQFERKYKQERRVADNTVDKHTSYIRNAFRCARKGKLAGGKFTRNNPLEDYEFEKHSNPRNVTLTREQKLRLLKECLNSRNHDLLTFVLIAINTGMRLREILGMRWAQVDLENRAIQLFISKTGQRIIRMNNTVLKYFQTRERGADTDRVFSDRNPRSAWEGARERAGLKFLRLHDLRHVFATDLKKKTSTKNVQKALGHATETMTEIYINVADDELLETVCLLDDGVDELIQAVQNDTKIDTKPQSGKTITESGS